ncbi:MAG: hypothetical protein KDC09_09745 [Bacteroidales bacterium]|nr:hypothetical protein [Bacteroidales bacterium]
MFTIEEKKAIKSKLPHGSLRLIAKMAGVSPQSVAGWFSDRVKSSKKIEDAAISLLRKCKEDKERKLAGLL